MFGSVCVVWLKLLRFQFNRRNNVYFNSIAHCVCCVWESLERVCRGSVQQVAV